MAGKLIGVLAGMGPRSTAPFVDMLMTQCQKQYGAIFDKDFPEVMIYSLPTPFYVNRAINHDEVRDTILAGLKKLEKFGVDFIAMPCNAAHIYYDELASQISIPLLDMVKETIASIPRSAERIALLGTRPAIEAGVYQAQMAKAGYDFTVDDEWQKHTDKLILEIKTSNQIHDAANQWNVFLDSLSDSGIDTILLVCTDLNAVSTMLRTELTIVNSASCLAQATIKRWRVTS